MQDGDKRSLFQSRATRDVWERRFEGYAIASGSGAVITLGNAPRSGVEKKFDSCALRGDGFKDPDN